MKYVRIVILLLFVTVLLPSWACGKKAPPRMPMGYSTLCGPDLERVYG